MARENPTRIMAPASTPYQISTRATRRMSSRSMLERTTPISKARTPASNKNKRWCAMAKCKSAVIANLLIDELTKDRDGAFVLGSIRAALISGSPILMTTTTRIQRPASQGGDAGQYGLVLIIQRR